MESIRPRSEDEEPDLPLAYAPKWVRGASQSAEVAVGRSDGPAPWQVSPGSRSPNLLPQGWLAKSGQSAPAADTSERGRMARRSLEPVPVPAPQDDEDDEGRSPLGLWIAGGVTVAAAATVAFVVVTMLFPGASDKRTARNDRAILANSAPLSASGGLPSRDPQSAASASWTASPAAPSTAAAAPAVPMPTALAAAAGSAAPLPAVAAAAPDAPAAPAAAEDRQTAPGGHLLDPEEVVVLTKRGETLLKTGNVEAARLVLQWPAEVGDARAALALGSTFDPSVLKQLRVVGSVPDLAQARAWYDKAASLGSAEASRRLRQLPR